MNYAPDLIVEDPLFDDQPYVPCANARVIMEEVGGYLEPTLVVGINQPGQNRYDIDVVEDNMDTVLSVVNETFFGDIIVARKKAMAAAAWTPCAPRIKAGRSEIEFHVACLENAFIKSHYCRPGIVFVNVSTGMFKRLVNSDVHTYELYYVGLTSDELKMKLRELANVVARADLGATYLETRVHVVANYDEVPEGAYYGFRQRPRRGGYGFELNPYHPYVASNMIQAIKMIGDSPREYAYTYMYGAELLSGELSLKGNFFRYPWSAYGAEFSKYFGVFDPLLCGSFFFCACTYKYKEPSSHPKWATLPDMIYTKELPTFVLKETSLGKMLVSCDDRQIYDVVASVIPVSRFQIMASLASEFQLLVAPPSYAPVVETEVGVAAIPQLREVRDNLMAYADGKLTGTTEKGAMNLKVKSVLRELRSFLSRSYLAALDELLTKAMVGETDLRGKIESVLDRQTVTNVRGLVADDVNYVPVDPVVKYFVTRFDGFRHENNMLIVEKVKTSECTDEMFASLIIGVAAVFGKHSAKRKAKAGYLSPDVHVRWVNGPKGRILEVAADRGVTPLIGVGKVKGLFFNGFYCAKTNDSITMTRDGQVPTMIMSLPEYIEGVARSSVHEFAWAMNYEKELNTAPPFEYGPPVAELVDGIWTDCDKRVVNDQDEQIGVVLPVEMDNLNEMEDVH